VSVLEQLLGVQELDTTIDQLEHRRASLPERQELTAIGIEEQALAERRRVVDEEAAALDRSQKRLEDDLATVETRRSEADQRLYSGTVTSPRELQALQDEVASLGRRTSEIEDDLLEVMTATEPVDAALASLDAEAAALAERRSAAEARIRAAETELDAELAATRRQRDEVAVGVPPDQLQEYERRRPQLGGVAIARLRGNSCGGCHLSLSAVEIDRIRKLPSDEAATCEECGRMLVH
jgi:uncharacterized protein